MLFTCGGERGNVDQTLDPTILCATYMNIDTLSYFELFEIKLYNKQCAFLYNALYHLG